MTTPWFRAAWSSSPCSSSSSTSSPTSRWPGSIRASGWERTVTSLGRLRPLAAGGLILAVAMGAAVLAPLLAPHDPYAQAVGARLIPPVWEEGGGWANALGTDPLGRDLLSRIIYGARISISAAALAVSVSMVLGRSEEHTSELQSHHDIVCRL